MKEHLSVLEKLKTKKPTVFVYKGFPVHFVQELISRIPHIDKLSCIDSSNHIDLDKIIKNADALVGKLKKTKENKLFITYEEFLLIPSDSISELPVIFKIIKNNFYEFYPNQTSQLFPDIESSLNSEIEIDEDENFIRFYADCREIAGYNCIQFLDHEADLIAAQIETINFFDTDDVPLPEYKTDSSKAKNTIQFQSSDSSYFDLKFGLYNNVIPKEVNLLVDESIDHLPNDLAELKLLYKILSACGCSISLYRSQKQFESHIRPELTTLLKKHWGEKAEFKKLNIYKSPDASKELVEHSQGAIVEHIIKQVEKAHDDLLFEDVFLTAPTGAGKSLLFQLPAIYLAESKKLNAVTIVISPLKALMYDQVNALKNDRNFDKVAFVNSDLSLVERQEIIDKTISGELSILYMSPELLLAYEIQLFIGTRELGLLIIDEAHLVTTWGRDFRIDYWFLGNYIRKLRSAGTLKGKTKNKFKTYRFPVVALTATAVYNGKDDMVFDTIRTLNMQNCRTYIGRIKREEISFEYNKLEVGKHDVEKELKTIERIKQFIKDDKKSIVYFPWVSQIRHLLNTLDFDVKAHVKRYYGEVNATERAQTIQDFKSGKAKIVLATKAFGMGVDISDIEVIYHHAPSGSLADYVQEIGRGARIPGMKGKAMLDFNPKDLKYTKALFMLSSLKQYQVDLVLKKINKLFLLFKKRNMLVSIEDFKWIFSRENDPEGKVKSAMLVIEKDLWARYGYNVVMIKPKGMFSTVYGSVDDEGYDTLVEKYGAFVQEVKKTKYKHSGTKLKNGAIVMREEKENKKNVKITLDKLWENHFPEESFPDVRKKFFDKRLFPYVEPLKKLRVSFNAPIDLTFTKLENGINFIGGIFHALGGKMFRMEDLKRQFETRIKNEITCIKLCELLLGSFAEKDEFGGTGKAGMSTGNFLKVKSFGALQQYRFDAIAFSKVKTQMLRTFQISFDAMSEGSLEYIGFIAADIEKAKEKIKLIFLLETFDLSLYEISGGESPQLMVRMNDPKKVADLCKEKYINNVVADIERRHHLSMDTMNYFFQNKMNNIQRWDYIEDYFLGKDVSVADVTEELEVEEGE